MYEVIHIKVKAIDDYEDKVQMLTICPLASLAKGFGHHLLKVGTSIIHKGAFTIT
jgi:hypothetical protein